ncbi:hypothetical protein SAMN05421847_1752 [Halpernia humi]|uniref:Uncharacterized protein n=1 Tax=Halpernia humi TaxID=493375 RepID=A0A1H5YAX0_9FLAO|nr:hypothetical protein [Halpernia humi]SEG21181.1 hypothetical protein SAMN05421847_1752 [Halpernia humi]
MLLSIISFSQKSNENISFKLIEKKESSEINYLTIKNINSLNHGLDSMKVYFKPVKGQYTTYTFVKEFDGIKSDDFNKTKLHDIVILKTDSLNNILDGFYYRLDWAEVPSQFMIFRSFAKNLKLKDNLNISELEFYNEYEMYSNQTEDELRKPTWCENDILKLN